MNALGFLPAGSMLPAEATFPSTLEQLGKGIMSAAPGASAGLSIGSVLFSPGGLARIITGLLGLILIAAAIFTHPTVVKITEKAASAAAVAA